MRYAGNPAELHRLGQIPFQSIIFFVPETVVFEEVPVGQFASANGRAVRGPAIIAREWDLRGVAVTPRGKDLGTQAKFSGQFSNGRAYQVEFRPKWEDVFKPAFA